MSARQSQGLAGNFIRSRGREKLLRKFVLKCGVVTAADGEQLLACSAQFRKIRNRADGRPVAAKFLLRDFRAQRFPNVNCGEAGGDHVAKIRRDVQERGGANQRLVRRRDTGDARTEAGSQNSERAVTALSEPSEAASRVANSLTIGLESQPNIWADDVVSLGMARYGAMVVIRQAQAQRTDSQAIQPAANVNVGAVICVPLRQDYHGGADCTGREKARADVIVFLPGRIDGAGERED